MQRQTIAKRWNRSTLSNIFPPQILAFRIDAGDCLQYCIRSFQGDILWSSQHSSRGTGTVLGWSTCELGWSTCELGWSTCELGFFQWRFFGYAKIPPTFIGVVKHTNLHLGQKFTKATGTKPFHATGTSAAKFQWQVVNPFNLKNRIGYNPGVWTSKLDVSRRPKLAGQKIGHMCQGLNSHYFHIIGDGHQPNSRGLYTHYKDSY